MPENKKLMHYLDVEALFDEAIAYGDPRSWEEFLEDYRPFIDPTSWETLQCQS